MKNGRLFLNWTVKLTLPIQVRVFHQSFYFLLHSLYMLPFLVPIQFVILLSLLRQLEDFLSLLLRPKLTSCRDRGKKDVEKETRRRQRRNKEREKLKLKPKLKVWARQLVPQSCSLTSSLINFSSQPTPMEPLWAVKLNFFFCANNFLEYTHRRVTTSKNRSLNSGLSN